MVNVWILTIKYVIRKITVWQRTLKKIMIPFHFTFTYKRYWRASGGREITSTSGHFEKFQKKSWIWGTPYKRGKISLGTRGIRVCWLEWIEETKVGMTHNDSSHLFSAYYLSGNLSPIILTMTVNPHSVNGETQDQRYWVICCRPHSSEVTEAESISQSSLTLD